MYHNHSSAIEGFFNFYAKKQPSYTAHKKIDKIAKQNLNLINGYSLEDIIANSKLKINFDNFDIDEKGVQKKINSFIKLTSNVYNEKQIKKEINQNKLKNCRIFFKDDFQTISNSDSLEKGIFRRKVIQIKQFILKTLILSRVVLKIENEADLQKVKFWTINIRGQDRKSTR